MASLNKIHLIGNLGNDPESQVMKSGDVLTKFSLATTETWTSKDGSKQEKTEWHRCELWGKIAEIARDYCSKGKQVYLEGQMTYEEYEKDGVKKTSAKVKLSGPRAVLVLLGGGERGKPNQSERPRSEPSQEYQSDEGEVPF